MTNEINYWNNNLIINKTNKIVYKLSFWTQV